MFSANVMSAGTLLGRARVTTERRVDLIVVAMMDSPFCTVRFTVDSFVRDCDVSLFGNGSMLTGPSASGTGRGPSFLGSGPSFLGSEPFFVGAGPVFFGSEPSFVGAGPSFLGSEP
jgi:hypothetical protein